jgi:arsenate reductase (thioredoxin)
MSINVKPKVLFLCTSNSARSQIAEGLLRNLYGDIYEAFSAGATPTTIHPLAVKVMKEIGIDISGQSSKSIEEFRGKDIDLAVTVCKNNTRLTCPFCSTPSTLGRPDIIKYTLTGAKHWIEHGFNDPADAEGSEDEKLASFRKTRDEIREWVKDFFSNPERINSEGKV